MEPLERNVLGLFAKWPRAGQVKTRLASQTSSEWAARVAKAFLKDTVSRFAGVAGRRILAYTPTEAKAEFEGLVQSRFELQPQIQGDLGTRMAAFFADCFISGAERVVLVGSDSPTLPVSHVEKAYQLLEHADVVLCPALDGGYCLVGSSRQLPVIFDGIAWGTSSVLAETVARAKQGNLKLGLLPPWYDVDTLEDWNMLIGHIAAMRLASVDPEVLCTERLLWADQPSPK